MEEMVIRKNNSYKTVDVVVKSYVILVLIAHMFCIYMHVIGMSYAFGTLVSVTTSIEMIFGVLSMSGGYYRAICSAVLGLLYLGLLIYMIKNLCSSFTMCSKLMKGNKPTLTNKTTISSYGRMVSRSFFSTVIFAFVCTMVEKCNLPNDLYLIMLLWGLIAVVTKIVCSLADGYTLITIVTKAVYDIVGIAALMLLLVMTKYPVLEDVVYAIKGLPISLAQSILAVLMPAIYGVLIIKILAVLNDATNEYINLQNNTMIKQTKILVYLSVSLGICAIVVYALSGYEARLDFKKIATMFRPYVAPISVSVAAMITMMIPVDYIKINNSDDKKFQFYTIDKNGELYINDGVTEIEPFAFKNRTDITKVFIPSTVKIVGKGAFSGCDKITSIHCNFESLPDEWSKKWNENCNARVDFKSSANSCD